MLVEALCILAVVTFLLGMYDKAQQRYARSVLEAEATRRAQQEAMRPVRILDLPGSTAFPMAAKQFVAAFGIDPWQVTDIRTLDGPLVDLAAAPSPVRDRLNRLYREGNVRGAEAVAVLHHGRGLDADEALYFSLVDLDDGTHHAVAFVDRKRA